MIRVEDAWYTYDGRSWVLRGASLTLHESRVTVVVGPNGAGKTTLLKIAGLLYKPHRGHVSLYGREPWVDGGLVEARRLVVYVHEKPVMLRGSVAYNIGYGLLLRGYDWSRAQRVVEKLARRLGIEALLDKPARGLSAGQAQLVAIARALAVEPRFLLLDEPFAHLDSPRRRLLLRILAEERDSGMGIAVATHDTLLASRIADEAVEVADGRTRLLEGLDELYP